MKLCLSRTGLSRPRLVLPALSALAVAASLGFAMPAAAMSDDDKIAVRTELQIVMQRTIDRSMVDGAVLHVDLTTGAMAEMYPTAAHPMIMQGDGFYVLCADLTNAAGETIDVDYYVVESSRGYKVFRTEIDNRQILDTLTSKGEITEF